MRVFEAEGDSSNRETGNWTKNRHRWRWSEVDDAGEASAQVRHGFLASVIPLLLYVWWWYKGGRSKPLTRLRKGYVRKQKMAQVDIEPSALLDCCPTKAVAAGTPATSGPWKGQMTQAHCLNQRIPLTWKQGQEPNKTKPVVMLYTMGKSTLRTSGLQNSKCFGQQKKEVAVVGEPVLQANTFTV